MNNWTLAALTALLSPALCTAQDIDYNNIAHNIVTNTADIQPGEIVLIRGSVEALDIFEAIVAQTLIAGGQPIPYIEFPRAADKALKESPLEHLRLEPTAELALMANTDVFIGITPGFNPAEFMSNPVAPERRMAYQQGRAPFYEAAASGDWREVYVGQSSGVPTPGFADYSNADFGEFSRIFYEALSVDPAALEETGSRLRSQLTPGARVHVSGPQGTDLNLVLSDDGTRMTAGRFADNESQDGPAQVYLPAGEIAACVDPTSANGTLHIPSFMFRAEEITGITLTFADGVVTDVNADTGESLFKDFVDSQDAAALTLSLINIGFNPYSRISEGSNYRSWEMGGLVTTFLGDNTIYGCSHTARNRIHPHIEGLTLEVEGEPLVVNGELVQALH